LILARIALPESWVLLKVASKKTKHAVVIEVSKKVMPLSTDRSRVKRLIREALRLGSHRPPKGSQWRLIVRKKIPKDTKMQDVKQCLDQEILGRTS